MAQLTIPGGDVFRAAANIFSNGIPATPITITQAAEDSGVGLLVQATNGAFSGDIFEVKFTSTVVFSVATNSAQVIGDLQMVNGSIVITNNSGTAGRLYFSEPSGSGVNATSIRAQAQSADIDYIWPAAIGTTGQVLQITTSGSTGTLSWATAGGGSALPTWTFSAAGGDPTAGQFKTDNASPASTTTLRIAGTTAGGGTGTDAVLSLLSPSIGGQVVLNITNTATGECGLFTVVTATDSGTFTTLTGAVVAGLSSAWSGTYSVYFWREITTQPVYSVNGNSPDGSGSVTLSAFSGSGLVTVDVSAGVVTAGT